MTMKSENIKIAYPDPDGVLIVNKHGGATSHDVVGDIRHIYHTRKVGHTGTLDPMAEGVLVILLGRAAKAAEYLVSDRKIYRATLRLGLTTDTEDVTGTVLSTCDALPDAETVKQVCNEQFVGKIKQIPPMYSALKVNGQKLCDLARAGKTVERAAREIEIFSLECTPVENVPSDYILTVECSSGTYIRTLCADIGASLGVGGVMASLIRLEAGGFRIENAMCVADLRKESIDELYAHLKPTESLFTSLARLSLPSFYERLLRNGCSVAQKKLRTSFTIGERVRLCSQDGTFFGLGEVLPSEDSAEGTIKCIKLFLL